MSLYLPKWAVKFYNPANMLLLIFVIADEEWEEGTDTRQCMRSQLVAEWLGL